MRIIAALLGLFLLAGMPASAQAPEPPAQVRELLKLLGEPAVRSWLDAELKKAPPKAQGAESSFSRFAAERLALTRARLNRLGAAVPQLPLELRDAGAVLGGELQNRSPLDILVLVLGFGLLGAGAEWAFRRATPRACGPSTRPSTPSRIACGRRPSASASVLPRCWSSPPVA